MIPTRDEIIATIIRTIGEVVRDWNLSADIGRGTRLIADLGFTSMDVIDLFAMLDLAFGRKLPYESFVLAETGEYRQEMIIEDLAAFIEANFDVPREGVHAV